MTLGDSAYVTVGTKYQHQITLNPPKCKDFTKTKRQNKKE